MAHNIRRMPCRLLLLRAGGTDAVGATGEMEMVFTPKVGFAS